MSEELKEYLLNIVQEGVVKEEPRSVVVEAPLTLFINREELVTLLAIPAHMEELAIGFLLSEGFITRRDELKELRVEDGGKVYVEIKGASPLAERTFLKRTITSGCGRGTIFYNVMDSLKISPLSSALYFTRTEIFARMQDLVKSANVYQQSGSVHCSGLAQPASLLYSCEDIGRHNATDKVIGYAFLNDIPLTDKLILTTGRLSSEIVVKAAKQRIPLVASLSGPTSLAVDIARAVGLTLVGYVKPKSLRVYSHPQRLTAV